MSIPLLPQLGRDRACVGKHHSAIDHIEETATSQVAMDNT
jgi:hypothetical protein